MQASYFIKVIPRRAGFARAVDFLFPAFSEIASDFPLIIINF